MSRTHALLLTVLAVLAAQAAIWLVKPEMEANFVLKAVYCASVLMFLAASARALFIVGDGIIREYRDTMLGSLAYATAIAAAVVSLWHIADVVLARVPVAPENQNWTKPDRLSLEARDGVVAINGQIRLEDFYDLERIITSGDAVKILKLNSKGGSIPAARGLVRLIGEQGISTHVDKHCFSACALIFMAGTARSLGPEAQLGFHQYATHRAENIGQQSLVEVPEEQARDREFFLSRGLSPEFVNRIFEAGHDTIWIPTRAELEAAGVLVPSG